ncbi:histone-lysine N-methyltransferase [Gordonibacter sp. 28C]|uniref:histone-lysine N-methyltransferase n=1 Tax=Gordonibacter sp. 28C TaxID=2078569 RepID=UPI000DF75CD4|nr:histone-lysine N-methyltransferase [Gordonibacter sp. 28C]RDB60394.1 histone-lysine N-methyltransferase [Gordonibacter sp. 28C]
MPKHAANEPHGTSSNPADRVSASDAPVPDDERDDRIGLTEAFSPVSVDPVVDEPDAPAEGRDNAIGLTQAFAPVGGSSEGPAHAGGFSYKGDTDDEYPDAFDSLEPREVPPLLLAEDELPLEPEQPVGRHGKKDKPDVPPHMRKSRRMRRVLIVVVVLLAVLLAALGYFTFRLIDESQTLATQQTQQQQDAQEVTAIQQEETKDASTETAKKTEAPDLASVLGLTQDEAVAALKHGAEVTSSKDVNEEGNPVKKNVTVALTDEPADTRTGTPTVYLGLNEEGKVVQAGYSASTAALGYGSLSFADAVKNEHVVEKTLQEAGIPVAEGAATLPEDKTVYSTYDTDGTTLVKENCSFSGTVDLNGAAHEWSAVLSYNYTTANMSGNLADTVRIIYVYINA